jgi:predicted MFS family arabinose efflux permease
MSLIVGVVIYFYLQPIDTHLQLERGRSALRQLLYTLTQSRYLQGFAATALLSTGGFMLMPFGSAFNVHNLGVRLDHLPLIYIATGAVSILTGPWVGRLSDRYGKYSIFLTGSIMTAIMVLIYTRLNMVPLWIVMVTSILMFSGVSARMISSSALMSALPEPADRGSYMSVSSSIQQISGGIAAAFAGLIVVQNAQGGLEHFDSLGNVIVFTTILTALMMAYINRLIRDRMIHERKPGLK